MRRRSHDLWAVVYRYFPWRYNPQYSGLVSPLGMDAACTIRLSQAVGLPSLAPITPCLLAIALRARTLPSRGSSTNSCTTSAGRACRSRLRLVAEWGGPL